MAITLIDQGFVSREALRAWGAQETSRVLNILLGWSEGEFSFEEGRPTPDNRLLVSLSVSALLQEFSAPPVEPQPQPSRAPSTFSFPQKQVLSPVTPDEHPALSPTAQPVQVSPAPVAAPFPAPVGQSVLVEAERVPEAAGLFSAAELLGDAVGQSMNTALGGFGEEDVPYVTDVLDGGPTTTGSLGSSLTANINGSLTLPRPVPPPPVPPRKDISFMRPDMVMIPLDISAKREANLQLALTPEHWRVLTRADGKTTLGEACQSLAMSSDLVCQVASDLVTLGLIGVGLPVPVLSELSPVSREYIMAGVGNGLLQPGFAASPAQPWNAATPTTDSFGRFPAQGTPLETQSQWGNGGNGAMFVLGGGWVARA